MKKTYYALAVASTLFGGGLLVLQVIGGLEYTHGASPYAQASMVAAMVTVAILPVFVHAAWRMSRTISIVLFVGFVAFLAYSLPANVGRIGEVKEVKALAAGDAANLEADLKSISRTLMVAQPQMEAECLGAPDPLPLDRNRWPECRRKRGTVTALLNDRARITSELRGMGTARVGDLGSETLAWALSLTGISAGTIRKGSGMAYAIGLEVIIFAMFALVAVSLRRAGEGVEVQRAVRAEPLIADKALTESELDQLRKLLIGAGRPLTNQEVASLAQISEGEATKRVNEAVALGLVQKVRAGRHVAISATCH